MGKFSWLFPLLVLTREEAGEGGKGGRILQGRKSDFPSGGRAKQGQSIPPSHRLSDEGTGKRRDGNAEGNGNRRRKRESLPKPSRRGGNKGGVPFWGQRGGTASPPHRRGPLHRSIARQRSPPSSGRSWGVVGGPPLPPKPSRGAERRAAPAPFCRLWLEGGGGRPLLALPCPGDPPRTAGPEPGGARTPLPHRPRPSRSPAGQGPAPPSPAARANTPFYHGVSPPPTLLAHSRGLGWPLPPPQKKPLGSTPHQNPGALSP